MNSSDGLSKPPSSIVKGVENNSTAMDFSGMTPIAGASGMTKNSSSAQVNNAGSKKVLQFRLFKSLRDARDIKTKY